MIFEQYYLECLSQASYLIADETTGRAAVVDPRRDIEQYLDSAREHGVTIELVIETHFHADFLSGHLELATATGAQIGFGASAKPEFEARALHDGERISLGQVTLEILETPGHTPESISIAVYEHPDDAVPYGVLTGDTLFIGDVGRPDLLSSLGSTSEELATMLHHSLGDKLMRLPDATRVFPGHGAGSACGKNLSTALSSTIGEQRVSNYALQPMTRAEFVRVVTEGQVAAPSYFAFDAMRNREGHELLHELEQTDGADTRLPPSRTSARVRSCWTRGCRSIRDRTPGRLGERRPRGSGYASTSAVWSHPDEQIVLPDGRAGNRARGQGVARPHRLRPRRRVRREPL